MTEQTEQTERLLIFMGHTVKGTTFFRAIGGKPKSARIDGPDDIDKFIQENNGKKQVYTCLNPVITGLNVSHMTEDTDTPYIMNVLLDIDADRVGVDHKFMATQEEYERVWPVGLRIHALLGNKFPRIVFYSDRTGNGCRFILPVPKVDVSTEEKGEFWNGQIKAFYAWVEEESKATLDKSVYNPSRITGVPGTMNIKETAEGRKHRLREFGVIPERVESQELLDFIMSLEPVKKTKTKQKQATTGEAPAINDTTKVHHSVVLKDLIKTDTEFVRLYGGQLTADETDKSAVEMVVVNKIIKRSYQFNKNGLNFLELDEIMKKCKIGKWINEKKHYRQTTYNSSLGFCEPDEETTAEPEHDIIQEFKPGIFLISDFNGDRWKSGIYKDDKLLGHKYPSKVPLWEWDDSRDRGLKATMDNAGICSKEEAKKVLYDIVTNIPESDRHERTTEPEPNEDEPHDGESENIKEKYPKHVFDAANELLDNGVALDFIITMWNKRHVGDWALGACCAASVGATCITNTAGLHMKPSGDSGKGKSDALKTFVHLLPENMVIEGSLSGKAAFYDDDLTAGTVIFSDDTNLNDGIIDTVKKSTTNYQKSTWHNTVTKELKLAKREIPARVAWWFTSVDSFEDEQAANRFLCVDVDGGTEQDQKVYDKQIDLELAGVTGETVTDMILTCRAIYDILRQENYKIVVPFARALIWNNLNNRRNIDMFKDIIKSVALYSIRNREKINDTYIADIKDYEIALKIYRQISDTNTTNLSGVELEIMRFIQGKTFKAGQGSTTSTLGGATTKEIADHIKKSNGTARNHMVGRNGRLGLIDKVPGLVENKHTDTKFDRESGLGTSRKQHNFTYTGDSMGIESFCDVVSIDNKNVEREIAKYKEELNNTNFHTFTYDLHNFYKQCKSNNRTQETDIYNNNNNFHNNENIECENKKKEMDINNKDVCDFFIHDVPETCKSCESVKVVPPDNEHVCESCVKDVKSCKSYVKDVNPCKSVNESVNDEPGENTLEMKRLSKKDKDEILEKMKVHFEGSKCVKLTAKNLNQFGRFVQKEYDDYSIHDVTIDTKNKFNLEVPS
jgi:hypothetical protein